MIDHLFADVETILTWHDMYMMTWNDMSSWGVKLVMWHDTWMLIWPDTSSSSFLSLVIDHFSWNNWTSHYFLLSSIIIHRQSMIFFGCMKPSQNFVDPQPSTINYQIFLLAKSKSSRNSSIQESTIGELFWQTPALGKFNQILDEFGSFIYHSKWSRTLIHQTFPNYVDDSRPLICSIFQAMKENLDRWLTPTSQRTKMNPGHQFSSFANTENKSWSLIYSLCKT